MTNMNLRAIRGRWDSDGRLMDQDIEAALTTAEALREALALAEQYILVQLIWDKLSPELRNFAGRDLIIVRAALRLADGEGHD